MFARFGIYVGSASNNLNEYIVVDSWDKEPIRGFIFIVTLFSRAHNIFSNDFGGWTQHTQYNSIRGAPTKLIQITLNNQTIPIL